MTYLLALTLLTTNLSGNWTGTMTGTAFASTDPAYMVLAQDGTTISGTIGPDRDGQFKITKASIDGDIVTIEAQPGGTLRFVMKLDGDELTGDVFEDGQMIATIRFERVKQ